jgi:hypothetical protein
MAFLSSSVPYRAMKSSMLENTICDIVDWALEKRPSNKFDDLQTITKSSLCRRLGPQNAGITLLIEVVRSSNLFKLTALLGGTDIGCEKGIRRDNPAPAAATARAAP